MQIRDTILLELFRVQDIFFQPIFSSVSLSIQSEEIKKNILRLFPLDTGSGVSVFSNHSEMKKFRYISNLGLQKLQTTFS